MGGGHGKEPSSCLHKAADGIHLSTRQTAAAKKHQGNPQSLPLGHSLLHQRELLRRHHCGKEARRLQPGYHVAVVLLHRKAVSRHQQHRPGPRLLHQHQQPESQLVFQALRRLDEGNHGDLVQIFQHD